MPIAPRSDPPLEQRRPSRIWEPVILVVAKNEEELGDAGHSGRRDDAHLCHVRPHGVGRLAALPDEQFTRLQDWSSGVLIGTKRIVGRVTASQIASASAASVLLRLT